MPLEGKEEQQQSGRTEAAGGQKDSKRKKVVNFSNFRNPKSEVSFEKKRERAEERKKKSPLLSHLSSLFSLLSSSFAKSLFPLAAMAMGQSPTKNFSAVAYDEAGNKRKIALITGVTGQVSWEEERRGDSFFCFRDRDQ